MAVKNAAWAAYVIAMDLGASKKVVQATKRAWTAASAAAIRLR